MAGPAFHFAPSRGWMNDPNGLIHYRGRHHLFFQHNPHDVAPQNICWGHASSTDLVTWTEHPLALVPGSDGAYDDGGCWSGCAVRAGRSDEVVMVYSGNHRGVQLPCLAQVDDSAGGDLNRWRKWAGNPVLAERPRIDGLTEMRDHSVRADGGRWRQVLAGGVAGEGVLFGYSSSDLYRWSWDGVVLRARDLDLPGAVWECPDVFETDNGAFAIISVIDAARPRVIWVHGELQGYRLVPDSYGELDGGDRLVPDSYGELDGGDRLYAPQSYVDESGRRLLFGWLTTHNDPASAGRPSVGAMSLPRELSVHGGALHQSPAAELTRRRGTPTSVIVAPGQTHEALAVPGLPAFELQLSDGARTISLLDNNGRCLTIEPKAHAGARLLFDAGIVELFLDNGHAAAWTDLGLTAVTEVRVTPTAPLTLTLWPL